MILYFKVLLCQKLFVKIATDCRTGIYPRSYRSRIALIFHGTYFSWKRSELYCKNNLWVSFSWISTQYAIQINMDSFLCLKNDCENHITGYTVSIPFSLIIVYIFVLSCSIISALCEKLLYFCRKSADSAVRDGALLLRNKRTLFNKHIFLST